MKQTSVATFCAMIAIGMYLTISANFLKFMGFHYVEAGGSPLVKVHPALYLATLAASASLWQRAWTIDHRRSRLIDVRLGVFFFSLAAAGAYAMAMPGGGSLILLIDNFLPAALIAVTLGNASAPDLAQIARMTRSLLALNALLAIGEVICQRHLIPLYLNNQSYHESQHDFRPTALYDHPLTGAMATIIALGIGSAPGSTVMTRLTVRILHISALIAFGSRAAILLWTCCLISRHIPRLPGRLRNRAPRLAVALAVIMLISCLLVTPLGERLLGHAYWDPSADTRLNQWHILGRLDWQVIFFGMDRETLLNDVHQLDLQDGVAVIECFPLLLMIDFGIIGGGLLLAALVALALWCWHRCDTPRRAVLITVILVASCSNSLGRKCVILPILVAATLATSVTVRHTAIKRRFLRESGNAQRVGSLRDSNKLSVFRRQSELGQHADAEHSFYRER